MPETRHVPVMLEEVIAALNVRAGGRYVDCTLGRGGHTAAILDRAGYAASMAWSLSEVMEGSSVHYGGTVRMHSSPEYGLLDGWNRLRGTGNVIVADASCFTTSVEKNPALTSMAIAARAANRLAHDLKAGEVGRMKVLV